MTVPTLIFALISFFISILGSLLFPIVIFPFSLLSNSFNFGFTPSSSMSKLFGSFWTLNFISSKFIPSCLGIWILGIFISSFFSSSKFILPFLICISGFKFSEPSIFPLILSSGIIGPSGFIWPFFNPIIGFNSRLLLPLFIKLKFPEKWELPLYFNFKLLFGYSSEFFSSSPLFIIIFFPFINPSNLFGISKLICWSPLLGSISGSLSVGSWSIIILFFSRSIFSKEGTFIPCKLLLLPSPIFIFPLIGISIFDDGIRGILKSYLLSKYLLFCI